MTGRVAGRGPACAGCVVDAVRGPRAACDIAGFSAAPGVLSRALVTRQLEDDARTCAFRTLDGRTLLHANRQFRDAARQARRPEPLLHGRFEVDAGDVGREGGGLSMQEDGRGWP